MNKSWDEREEADKEERLKRQFQADMDRIPFTELQQQESLRQIRQAVRERRTNMRFHGKRMVIAVAAAMMAAGTITAVAAGKIAGLYSSTDLTKAVHSVTELQQQAASALGHSPELPETLADGTAFDEGQIIEVKGLDDGMNQVASYQELTAQYGDVNLSVMRTEDLTMMEGGAEQAVDYQETVGDIHFTGTEDPYLFLPPDARPSAEDEALEKAGELYISYGSEKEERTVYRNVVWEKDGLRYTLFTEREMTLPELGELAKAYAGQ